MAIAAAGTYPDRFTAVASFHGGNLATDEPTSPHLFASKLKARIYIAAADQGWREMFQLASNGFQEDD